MLTPRVEPLHRYRIKTATTLRDACTFLDEHFDFVHVVEARSAEDVAFLANAPFSDFLCSHMPARRFQCRICRESLVLACARIQATFRRHRGYSPMVFLQTARLDAARATLTSGRPCRVTDVAFGCGFAKLSSFTAAYRARFGELPSATLRRAVGPSALRQGSSVPGDFRADLSLPSNCFGGRRRSFINQGRKANV